MDRKAKGANEVDVVLTVSKVGDSVVFDVRIRPELAVRLVLALRQERDIVIEDEQKFVARKTRVIGMYGRIPMRKGGPARQRW
jgi:hypothetical protein